MKSAGWSRVAFAIEYSPCRHPAPTPGWVSLSLLKTPTDAAQPPGARQTSVDARRLPAEDVLLHAVDAGAARGAACQHGGPARATKEMARRWVRQGGSSLWVGCNTACDTLWQQARAGAEMRCQHELHGQPRPPQQRLAPGWRANRVSGVRPLKPDLPPSSQVGQHAATGTATERSGTTRPKDARQSRRATLHPGVGWLRGRRSATSLPSPCLPAVAAGAVCEQCQRQGVSCFSCPSNRTASCGRGETRWSARARVCVCVWGGHSNLPVVVAQVASACERGCHWRGGRRLTVGQHYYEAWRLFSSGRLFGRRPSRSSSRGAEQQQGRHGHHHLH